jgi:gamma-glutamylcyclotransferase (GGCT)/AIG2-like uncharacterized protein YtfP
MPVQGESVPGFVYKLTGEALAVLDSYEGHPVRYERETLSVTLANGGSTVEAAVYIKDLERPGPPPPEAYYETLRAAYERLGYDLEGLRAARERARAAGNR